MLLGEKLIAFRDTPGRVGVMDHRCPHRCASLFYGRNEASGIRCVYHGWKFDVDGNCLDMPNLPPEQEFKQKSMPKPTRSPNGPASIWVYMGARAEAPPFPEIEVLLLPDDDLDHRVRPARVQLAAGTGRRHRHLAFRLPACRQRAAGTGRRTTTC